MALSVSATVQLRGPAPPQALARRGRAQSAVVRAEGEATPAAPAFDPKSVAYLKPVKDVNEIMKILPHRYPFLLVDRVLDFEFQKHCVAIKLVTVNDNFFPGHFPQRPIMPGVLQIEALAQAGGICMLDPADPNKDNFFFGGIDECRFRRVVEPGDTLVLHVELEKFNKKFGIAKMKGTCYVGDKVASEAVLTLVMAGDKKV